MAVLHLALLWGNTTLPLTCLSGAQIIAHAIHCGFTHASHTSTHASHAYLPRSLSPVPRRPWSGSFLPSCKGILF